MALRVLVAVIAAVVCLGFGPANAAVHTVPALEAARNELEAVAARGEPNASTVLARKYLDLCEQAKRIEPLERARCQMRVAQAFTETGLLFEADAVLARAVPVLETTDKSRMFLARALVGRGLNDVRRGGDHWSRAEQELRAALAIYETADADYNIDFAEASAVLADLLNRNSSSDEVEGLLERALARIRGTAGSESMQATLLTQSARRDLNKFRFAQAEEKARQGLILKESVVGAKSYRLIGYVQALRDIVQAAGKFDEALSISQRFLKLTEDNLGQDSYLTAEALNGLATNYSRLERFADAEPLVRRAVEVSEKVSGAEDPKTAVHLNNLASVLEDRGKLDESVLLYRRALAIKLSKVGPEARTVATGHFNLGNALLTLGSLDEAQVNLERANALDNKLYGSLHTRVADSSLALSRLALRKGDLARALALASQASEIRLKLLGDRSTLTAASLFAKADAQAAAGDTRSAWQTAKQAVTVYQGFLRGLQPADAAVVRSIEFDGVLALASTPIEGVPAAEQERLAFTLLQLASQSTTALAVSQLGGRFATSDPSVQAMAAERERLSRLVREQQSGVARLYAANDQVKIANAQAELAATQQRFDTAARALAEIDPRYADQAATLTVDLDVLRSSGKLSRNEALLQMGQTKDALYLMVVTPTSSQLKRIPIGRVEMSQRVKVLRAGIDIRLAATRSDIPQFDMLAAHRLYADVFEPLSDALGGTRKLVVAAHGPLASLPLATLVTKPASQDSYRSARWLADRYGMSYTPSVASFMAWRETIQPSAAPLAMLAFADPTLGGKQTITDMTSFATLRGHDRSTTDAQLNARAICQMRPLPDARAEAAGLAGRLGAARSQVLVGGEASDAGLAGLNASGDLAKYRLILFATHGLASAGDGLEPALVLAPGDGCGSQRSDADGLLTSGEISRLNLDAEWVILSGCNTATADGQTNSAPLSGLARAFLQAGARRLLVSHWSVDSAATTKLMGELFDTKGNATAASLQKAMANVRRSGGDLAYRAHPAFWAPFVIVGDGG